MNEVKRILNYWKEVNLLTPVTVKSVGFKNQKSLSTKEILKVPYNRLEDSLLITDDKKYEIEIGFGDIKNTYLYEKGNIPKEDFVDGDGGETFIFAFKIDADKKYKEKSFTISKFSYILLKNIISKDYDDIENEIIKNTDLIKEIAVTEYKEQLLAIIYPDFQQIEAKKIVNIKDAIKWEVIDKYNVTAPNYKKIHDIKIVKKELPKTRIGKIRRFMLKDLIEDKDDVIEQKEEKKAIVVPPEMKEKFDIINKYIDERYHKAIDLDSHIELDLGFDSLDIVEFMNFLNETFGINLVEQDFVENKTISAIIKLVNEKAGKFVEKVDKNENLKKIIESDSDVKLPKDARYAKFLRVILGPFFRFYFKYKCIDKENIKDGAGIIVGNHQSYLDGFMVNNVFTTKEMNDNYYIATALHFKSKTMKYLANHGNIILVDANRNLKNTLQAAAKVLKNNKKLIIFPEGARTRDGQIHEFKKTFAILAKDLNVPIYPFVLKGAYEAFPYNKKFPKRNNVSVQFLERIEPKDKTVEELVEETKNNIAKNYY